MKIVLAGPISFDSLRVSIGDPIADAPQGGRETPIGPLSIELLNRGHEVHIVTLDSSVKKAICISLGSLKLHILPRRLRARDLALSFFSLEKKLLVESFRSIGPDIVHAHWTYEFGEAAVQSGLPHLVTMHDSPLKVLWYFRDAYRVFRCLMALLVIPRVKMLTVVSPYLVRHARLHGYFGKVDIIPNGVPVPAVSLALSLRMGRTIKIITVGDSGRRKNVSASVAAFLQIQREFPTAELHIFGPGLEGSGALSVNGVYRHGNVDHSTLMAFLAEEATLLIHPSREETFGVIIIEAMARGIPCIGGRRSGGVPYVFGNGFRELLVDVNDPTSIARVAVGLLIDADKYQKYSELGIQRVVKDFSQAVMADGYLAKYAEVINALEVE